MTLKYLALAYDNQSLEDIKNSQLNLNHIILIIPLSLHQIEKEDLKKFGKVIEIKNYRQVTLLFDVPSKTNQSLKNNTLSDEIITVSLKEFELNPYEYIIATHEEDLLRAAWLRNILDLPGQSYESALAFRQKTIMKSILQENDVIVPEFQSIKSAHDILDFIEDHPLPCIIKPDCGTGSSGITILHDRQDALHYVNNIFPAQQSQSLDLEIETFIEGTMYHVNGFFVDKSHGYYWPSVYAQQSIAMLEGKAASSYLLSPSNPLVSRLNDYARKVLTILPTPNNTAFHLEVFLTPSNEIIFCEIASRIGGKGVRQSWIESFNISLSHLFVHGQANIFEHQYINENLAKHFTHRLSGEIWFPVQEGQITHIEKQCPYPWVEKYHVYHHVGDVIEAQSENINDCLCGVSLMTAETEEEMKDRLAQVTQWVNETTQWSK